MRGSTTFGIFLRVLALAAVIFVFLVIHIWVRMQFVTESFRLSGLRSELRELEASRAVKQVVRDQLYKPHNLERLNITEQHSMRVPESQQIVDFEYGSYAR